MVGSWIVCRYEAVGSTQHVAADLVAAGAAHRTAIVADRQTAGYGRKGDVWHDEPGRSLLMTVILKPTEASQIPCLAMIAALSVIDAIGDVGHLHAVIKWPNDVLLNGRKVAGILGDATWRGSHLEAVRLGIGLNISGDRASFARRSLPDATSIAAETGRGVDRDAVLAAVLDHFAACEDRLNLGGVAETVEAWRHALVTLGQTVAVTLRDDRIIRGVADDVTNEGDLAVVTDAGMRVQLAASETRSLRHLGSDTDLSGQADRQ
ncbi:MAG: biotin--[acetyl-CoA-carboxylase] ligase [Chloroflexota bacterium]|nr:biotin--[acetyl-CoA-carboxylase] ligase [Chloroflexota bacterium]